ncbi:MAG: 16S rRNA (cytidine(1402)-2'-O)-methyltransferase [Bacteroidetes bacterium MED-G13]|nr:16S rRNA (cytidine(1402)-2'-O)-methyltransferase [Flavobacteriaceae bacterium]PDH47609.1 MAG: 16S rRNA (cytidine(1402)-2'-O)-methyltransferase [Bacteroidetes bacterium MED-G13]|tara:strand:+ start:20215 stop:20883 length:669 start_codon:yes stop_codon:yes gene_type:complete
MSKLFIVPTPIGNLKDITIRAIETLQSVDTVYAEDTRTSSKFLNHYEIKTPMQSFHMHNEHAKLENIISSFKQGKTGAIISDAGTPGISDPGFSLVRACIKNDIEVECLPGPTALIPALINSGFPCEKFSFEGFLPAKKGRTKRLKEIAVQEKTMIFYESPHRLVKTLKDFSQYFGVENQVSVSREISKKFEQTIRGTISQAIQHFEKNKPKGEFVIVLSTK